ncbi:MAG: hypothetical protein IJX27_08900, partial [Clostridia bacterium]|nr:hypothetical protein [Clostridia bacterium]
MLNRKFLEFLFIKGALVSMGESENAFAARFALANKFNISITSGAIYAHEDMLPFVADMLGEDVPDPFYRNFPASVSELSPDALLFDQLFHYAVTYGLDNFSEAGYSLFEEEFERLAFKEEAEIKKFVILTEEEAIEKLKGYIEDMLKGTRPLSDFHYNIVKAYINGYNYEIQECACKDTAIQLLMDSREPKYARFLFLSDVIKLVDIINYTYYDNENIKKLNLRNKDRKFISKMIDIIFESGYLNVRECFEKKAIWCGLLHHIHYQPKTPKAEKFVALMRGKENRSVYSEFERAMTASDIEAAVTCLCKGKGSGALLRHLNYILSRCKDESEIAFVMDSIKTDNAIILIQLTMQYANYAVDTGRFFKFTRYNRLRIHKETEEEQAKRKSALSSERVEELLAVMRKSLAELLAGKLGKVYISPEMYNIALPVQENTSSGGFGVLPKGSRIHIEEGKKIRAFTYWEKVNDIDLSVIGIGEDGRQTEFSWRTMYDSQSPELTFSGDQTAGYDGGSEYFDLDVALFKQKHPEIKHLVFCNNVYSTTTFAKCLCKAGYMLRDINDSGEVFEPKTVKSSFTINCDSTYAYLFAIDLEKNDFIWLNISRESDIHVAG